MRAREPDASGFVERDGVRVCWERFGAGEPALLFLGVDPIVESRMWKGQVPWFARRHTVVTFDPPGNGRSNRPIGPGGLHRRRARRRRPRRARRRRRRAGRRHRGVPGRRDRHRAGRRARRSGRRRRGHQPRAWRCRRSARPSRCRCDFDDELDSRRGLGQGEPPLLAARLAGLLRVLLRRAAPRAALDQAARGLRRMGRRHDARDHARLPRAAGDRSATIPRLPPSCAGRCAARCS